MKPLRRALLIQPYGIGDLLFITPAIRNLKEHGHFDIVDVMIGSRTHDMIRGNPFVDEIFIVDKDLFHRRNFMANFQDTWGLIRKLQKRKYDLLLDFSFRDEYGFISKYFLGIHQRAGYARGRRGMFHNIRVPIPEGFKNKPVTEFVLQMLEQAGLPVQNKKMDFFLSQEVRDQVQLMKHSYDEATTDYVVVSPGGGESWGRDAYFKRWPVEFFSKFIAEFCSKTNVQLIFIVGSPTEVNLCEELNKTLKVSSFNLAGRLSILQTAALIKNAKCFIGNDGGLVHIAHALEVPLAAFYGPVDPRVYGPYPGHRRAQVFFKEGLDCRPCYLNFRYNSACVTRECLQELSPDKVLRNFDFKIFTQKSAVES